VSSALYCRSEAHLSTTETPDGAIGNPHGRLDRAVMYLGVRCVPSFGSPALSLSSRFPRVAKTPPRPGCTLEG